MYVIQKYSTYSLSDTEWKSLARCIVGMVIGYPLWLPRHANEKTTTIATKIVSGAVPLISSKKLHIST